LTEQGATIFALHIIMHLTFTENEKHSMRCISIVAALPVLACMVSLTACASDDEFVANNITLPDQNFAPEGIA